MAEDTKKILPPEPEILVRIQKVRMKLAGSDRDDHVRETEQWEEQAKKALILLNLQGHEGIKMVLERARREIREINWKLTEERAVGGEFRSDWLINDSLEREDLIKMRRLWQWFLQLFGEAQENIQRITSELEVQESDDQISNE